MGWSLSVLSIRSNLTSPLFVLLSWMTSLNQSLQTTWYSWPGIKRLNRTATTGPAITFLKEKKIVGCSFEHATSWRSRVSSKSKKTKEPQFREKAQLFQGTVSQWQLFCYTGFVIKLSIKIRSGNRVVLHLFWLFLVKSFSLPKLWKSEVFELVCPMPSIDYSDTRVQYLMGFLIINYPGIWFEQYLTNFSNFFLQNKIIFFRF